MYDDSSEESERETGNINEKRMPSENTFKKYMSALEWLKMDHCEHLKSSNYSHMFKVKSRESDHCYAMKIVSVKKYKPMSLVEVMMLKKTKDINSDKRFAYVEFFNFFEYRGLTLIQMELLGPTLREFMVLNELTQYDIEDIRRIAYQYFTAVYFLHENNIYHGNISPDAIMFVNSVSYDFEKKKLVNGNIRLACFDGAEFDYEPGAVKLRELNYAAPEVLLEDEFDRSKADVWSMGMTLYELACGHPLIMQVSNNRTTEHGGVYLEMIHHIIGKIDKEKYNLTRIITNESVRNFMEDKIEVPPHIERYMSSTDVKNLLKFKANPSGAEQSVPILILGLVLDMTCIEPKHRVTVEEYLGHPFFRKIVSKKMNKKKKKLEAQKSNETTV